MDCPCRVDSNASGFDRQGAASSSAAAIPTAYATCCGPVHTNGAGLGTTATALMRARYSAYVLQLSEFLLSSWHPDTCPPDLGPVDPSHKWLGLEVIAAVDGGALDTAGTVEFKARFTRGSEFFELHERSTFVRVAGRWLYVDGVEPEAG